jgi:hypothetical protein
MHERAAAQTVGGIDEMLAEEDKRKLNESGEVRTKDSS